MKSLHDFHPLVIFSYFFAVIGLTMFYMHPILLIISFTGATVTSFLLLKKSFLKSIKWLLPFMLVAAILNPLLIHEGETAILYINEQPITVEAIVYGFAASVMLIAIIFWFSAFNAVMTSDKFLYLFTKISPAVALLISLTMRLVPLFGHQIKKIMYAQRAIGMDPSSGSVWHRIKAGTRILSILISWALESAIETADSMKARGYGLKGRSTFSLFRFDRLDGIALSGIFILFIMQLLCSYFGWNEFYYYPTFSPIVWDGSMIFMTISYGILVSLPIFIEVLEAFKWRSLKSIN